MSTRGDRRSWHRIISFCAAALLVSAGSVLTAQSSLAVHDTGMFELDGNILRDAANPPPYDWSDLFNADGSQKIIPDPVNGPILASAFVDDSALPDSSTFNGGTKIDEKLGSGNWGCGGPVSDKTSIDFVYAALIQIPANAPDNAGDQVLYLGLEKPSSGANGDNAFGFWLFKDPTVSCPGTGDFTGGHTDGDIFIDGTFTNGGGTSDVQVFRWNGNDATGSLGASPILEGAVCGGPANDDACAIANAGSITAGPWNSLATNAANTFVEAGIDLTTLFPNGGGCFTNFLAFSQASQSLSSQPKDFAAGQFNTCVPPGITTAATPGGVLNPPGVTTQHDVATISAVGGHPTPTGTVSFFLCGPADVTPAGCPTGGTKIGADVALATGSASSSNASAAQTATPGKYCWRAAYTPDADGAKFYVPGSETNANTTGTGAECFVVVHGTPSITTQSSANTDLGAAANSVGFTTVGDTATLSNVAAGSDLTGENISFSLYRLDTTPGANDCVVGARVFGPANGALTQVDATTWHATAPTYKPTAADGPGFYTWIASYAADQLNDGISGACGAANETVHLVGPLLTLTKGAPNDTITAGANVVYDVNLGNIGAGSASGVVVTDVLPILAGGGTWTLTGTNGYNCALAAGTGPNLGHQVLTCAVGELDPSSLTQIAELTAPTTTVDCGTISNTAVLAADPDITQSAGPINVTVQCPNLTISKTADAASVTVGDPSGIGFTVTVTNNGAGTASNVDIEDVLPPGAHISWSIASQTGTLICAIGGAPLTLSCTGSLASGTSEVVHITSPTLWNSDGNSCGSYMNTATVSADNAIILVPSASDTETVVCPNLGITKVADVDAVNVGSPIGFTITANNTGAGSASGALISDQLPAGVTWSIDGPGTSGPLTCGISVSGLLTCTGTLGAGQTEIVHITAPTGAGDCGTYDNTATLTATNTPQAPSGSDSVDVMCADLVIHKTADAASVSVGSPIGFTVTITNNGNGAANSVDVEDPLPAGAAQSGISWTVATSTGPLTCAISGAVPNQVLSCTGTLAASGQAGDAQSVHITSSTAWSADLNSCGTYDNRASVTWTFGPVDPISSELATVNVLCPQLAITKTADANVVDAGQSIGFTVVVTNPGPGTAAGVTLNDPLPAGADVTWSIDPAYAGPGTCTIGGAAPAQTLSCSFGDLAANTVITIHITSGTTPNSCGTYDNTATLRTTNTPGIAPGSDSITVQCPTLSLVKDADNAKVAAGKQIGFTITIGNAGPGAAHDVTVNDPLPGGKGIEWSIDAGGTTASGCAVNSVLDDQVLACAIGTLAGGTTIVVHVVSATTNDSCATYHNVVTLDASNAATLTAEADAGVTTCLGAAPTPTRTHSIAVTGAGPVQAELGTVFLLMLGGSLLLVLGRRPRRRGRHA